MWWNPPKTIDLMYILRKLVVDLMFGIHIMMELITSMNGHNLNFPGSEPGGFSIFLLS
jgi:hypothetical protein